MKKGDTLPALTDTLLVGGLPVDLTGATVSLVMTHMQGLETVEAEALTPAPTTSGVVLYDWEDGDTATSGMYRVEWRVEFPGGAIQTFQGDQFQFVEISGQGFSLGAFGTGDIRPASLILNKDDTLPAFEDTLQVGGVPVDLTGATVVLLMTHTGGQKSLAVDAEVVSPAASGGVRYTWATGDTSVSGVYRAEWQITFPADRVQTVPGATYRCVKVLGPVISSGALPSSSGGCPPATHMTLGTIKLDGDIEGTAEKPLVRGLPSRIIGSTDVDGVPELTIESYWGIDEFGQGYYDADGAVDEEAAVFGFDADGNPVLTTVVGVVITP